MKRKALSLALALVLVLALLPTAALGSDSDFVIEDGVLTKYNGSGGDVVIPDGVTSIWNCAFYGCVDLTSIIIPDSVTDILYDAFYGCTSLASINVASENSAYCSVDGVLFNKDKSELIMCPQGKRGAYTIPDGVSSIGDGAFEGCSNLASIAIGNGVTSIGGNAFEGCASLTSITIPNSVTSIEDGTFRDCTGLTSIVIPNSVTSIGRTSLYGCKSLTSVTVPDSVTSIGLRAFAYCTSLANITIPNSVTSIGKEAFSHCTSLTSVTIGNGVTGIEDGTFRSCTSLTSVTIPDSVTGISWYAFMDCTSLTSVTIPNSVTSIGSYAFKHTGLTHVTIPDSVYDIGHEAFLFCTNLTSVTMGNGVFIVREGAFSECSKLTDVYYSGTQEQWDQMWFSSGYGGYRFSWNTVIHYNSTGPVAPAVPTIVSTGIDPQDSGTAKESTQPVNIGGVVVQLQAYALVGESGSTNYVKIRDVAAALDGTASQFNVDWDGAVNLVTGSAYSSRNGQENQTPYSGDRPYTKATADTKVNGVVVPLQAFILLDDNGNGSTYYKLRDLGQALGFNVGWDKDRGIYIEPGVPYDANN